MSSEEIGKDVGRSRQAVDNYIADLRATIQSQLDLKIFKMNKLGITQERIAERLGLDQKTIHNIFRRNAKTGISPKYRFEKRIHSFSSR